MPRKASNSSSSKRKTSHKEKQFFLAPTGKTPRQEDFLKGLADKEMSIALGPAGTGKTYLATTYAAYLYKKGLIDKIVITRPTVPTGKSIGFFPGPQPLSAKVLTPEGWTEMGDIEKGQFVTAWDGTPVKVLGVFDKGEKEIYEIETTWGRKTRCCLDHLWFTETRENKKRKAKGSVKPLLEIIETLKDSRGKDNHALPLNLPVHFEEVEVPLDSYVLGVLLGDGWFGDSIGFASIDLEIVEQMEKTLEKLGLKVSKMSDSISYNISEPSLRSRKRKRKLMVDGVLYDGVLEASNCLKIDRTTLNSRANSESFKEVYFLPYEEPFSSRLKNILDSLGLLGKTHKDKFIPEVYFRSSVEERLKLIQGLMDTDGGCKSNGEASFNTTSTFLRDGLIELVRSLGGKATYHKRDPRKSILEERTIKGSTPCFTVNINFNNGINPFLLKRKAERFSTKQMKAEYITSVVKVSKENARCILIDHPDHLYVTDEFIVTHNTLEEKMSPWVAPFIGYLEDYLGKGDVENLMRNGSIEVVPFEVIRGRTFDNSFVILDEAQNCTDLEIKAFVTRHGMYSKTVINGDVRQSDLNGSGNGLETILSMWKRSKRLQEQVCLIEFTSEDIQRSGLCRTWVEEFDPS